MYIFFKYISNIFTRSAFGKTVIPGVSDCFLMCTETSAAGRKCKSTPPSSDHRIVIVTNSKGNSSDGGDNMPRNNL